MPRVKKNPEMIEGKKAFVNLQNAVKAVLKVPKSSVPSPFKKPSDKKNTNDSPKS